MGSRWVSVFLVEKLLKPDGWILFDDLNWTFASSPTLKNTKTVQNMPEDEKNTAQVEKIFLLLVCSHPNFVNFRIERKRGWDWAQKKKQGLETNSSRGFVYLDQSIAVDIKSIIKKMRRKLLD